jgi:hypothetical protein
MRHAQVLLELVLVHVQKTAEILRSSSGSVNKTWRQSKNETEKRRDADEGRIHGSLL